MTGEGEPTKARRSALKRDYRKLYDRVADILFRVDPAGINFEDNTDEYHPETGTILPRLANCASESEVRRVVVEEFTRWFDAETVSRAHQNQFDRIASEIWSALQIFRGRNLPTHEGQAQD